MKKIMFSLLSATAMLWSASCADEAIVAPAGEGEAMVNFTVNLNDGNESRAVSDGTTVNTLYYEVYAYSKNAQGELVRNETPTSLDGTVEIIGKTAKVGFPLVKNQKYDVVFWAQWESENHAVKAYNAENLTAINVLAEGDGLLPITANDDRRDAFTAIEPITVTGAQSKTVTLTRPFAQVNFGTPWADVVDAEDAGANIQAATSQIKATRVASVYDATTGAATEEVTYTFEAAPLYKMGNEETGVDVEEELVVNGKNYEYLATTYVLVPSNDAKVLSDLEMTITTGLNQDITIKVPAAPVQRNYRTNVLGNLLTNQTDFTVEIDADFDGDLPSAEDEIGSLFVMAATGGKFTLSNDLELEQTLTVQPGVSLEIDLNGKTITNKVGRDTDNNRIHTIVNNGQLIVKNGTVKSEGVNGGSAIYNNEGATLNIEDVKVYGAPIADGAWPSYGINNYGTLTVDGAEIYTYHGAIATGGDGVAVINDATIDVGQSTQTKQTSWALYTFENGQFTVNGGTFKNTKDEQNKVYGGGYICATSTKETIINGGTFDKTEGDNNGSGIYYNCSNLVIKGGVFDTNPTKHIAEGYKAVEKNGVWTVIAIADNAEAFIAAVANGGIVSLQENITISETITVAEGKNVTIELNGKTITGPINARDAEGNRIHIIVNKGNLTINGGTISSIAENGGSAILNTGILTLNEVTANGAPSNTDTGTASYAVNTEGAGSKLTVNNSTINGRGAIGATKGTKVEINGGKYHTPAVAWGHAIYATNEGTEVVINDGIFSEGYEMTPNNWGMYQIYSGDKAKVTVNGGTFMPWDCANGYDLCTASEGVIEIYGGTFAEDPSNQNKKNYVAEGYAVAKNEENGTYTVIPTTLKDGAVLDLGGAEYDETITVEGNVTIKGDTKIKTLKSTTGCTITIEDGKTLTLNNFSFGAKDNAEAVYEIKGGTVTANYGFFQHGKYTLHSNFETGHMYYSYGSDITVYGTFHSQGKGDGLDYVRGKLTIAKGGKSIHDKSLWVGQPASWGAMNASLVIEEGGYVQANSLSVYEGSTLTYSNDADLKYNNVTGTEYITKK